jgi:hypothetical protein
VIALCLAALLLGASAVAGPGEIRVVASGVGYVVDDPAASRSLALKEGLRAALEQAVGRLVLSDTLARFYPLVSEELLDDPDSYISGYGVVSESSTEGHIRVTVSANIPLAPLREALERLGVFVPEEQRPKVLIAVAERSDEETAFTRWWSGLGFSKPQTLPFSERLAALLTGRGLVVIPFKIHPDERAGGDDPVSVARSSGAIAAVVGDATLKTRRGELQTGTVNLKVVSAQGEGLIMSVNVTEDAPPEEERPPGWSMAKALADRIGPEMASRIRGRFFVARSTSRQITLGLTGLNSLKQYHMVKKFLAEAVPQVKMIKEKTVGPGRALLVVEAVGGRAPAIKEALAGARMNGYTFKVKEISENVLEAELILGSHNPD